VTNKILTLSLLRHGVLYSGGARYEEFLLDSLSAELKARSIFVKSDKEVFARLYKGLANIRLIAEGLKSSKADVNIVTARLGLGSVVRNLFTRNKVIIVLHYFDIKDGKGLFLKMYYALLFYTLKRKLSRTAIVCVSPFFENYFKNVFPYIPVICIPNLFKNNDYQVYKVDKNISKVILGQYSPKNDNSGFELAKKLTLAGYHCIFFTLDPSQAGKYADYEIKCVPFSAYLQEMASAYCTIAIPYVNEGWNRIAHESLLVGTPVIGYARGGLGNLLTESNSYIVNNADEAYELIIQKKVQYRTSEKFIEKYDAGNSGLFLKPLVDFIML